MDEIILFDKSFQERLSEYEQLFSGSASIPYSRLETEWYYYLELTIDRSGWQAVWKIPRLKCEEFKISFPTIVLVYVINVSFPELTALVRILAVQDDIHLPEKHHVPLAQLWPTKQQDKSIALNMDLTANAVDMYRFFSLNLLMPWDEEEDSADWVQDHLVSRLKLYYDLRNGKIPKPMCEHINTLINEAKRLSNKREQLTNICDGLDSDVDESNDKVQSLIEINVRLIEIQNEMYLLENELFRKVILNRQDSRESEASDLKDKSQVWLVTKPDTPTNYIEHLKIVSEIYPNVPISFSHNLMAKLETANADEIMLLSPEEHKIKSEGVLLENCIIKGIYPNKPAQITSLVKDVTFDCVGSSLVLENITFNCQKSQCALLVRKGHLTLKNCKIIGDNSFTTHHGILVLNEARLSLESCSLFGFSTAIVGNTGSSISIQECAISEAICGILVHNNCELKIRQSSIDSCKDYGIVVETDEELSFDASGNEGAFDVLKAFSYISVDGLKGNNNVNGDVTVKRCNIKARENLFDNPEFDPTFIEENEDFDEEMESNQSDLNCTVISIN